MYMSIAVATVWDRFLCLARLLRRCSVCAVFESTRAEIITLGLGVERLRFEVTTELVHEYVYDCQEKTSIVAELAAIAAHHRCPHL
jgi:hypothetical protein